MHDPGFEQGCLQSSPAHLRESCCPGKQSDPVMETESACCRGLAVQLGDKVHRVLAGKCHWTEFTEKIQQLGMFVSPSPRVDLRA